jgi:acyl-CoA synthetase (AMP-forming)/AMP-acid ligase II
MQALNILKHVLTLEDVRAMSKEEINRVLAYKLPERIEIVKEIPRNPVGKILKKELREDIKRR